MSGTKSKEFSWVTTAPGVRRRVLAEHPDAMIVEFAFERGGVGALHHHVHLQTTYVVSGTFDFSIAEKTVHLMPGGSVIIPSNVTHGCTCIEPGSLIDTFTPRRDDFL